MSLQEIESRHERDKRLTHIARASAPEWAVDAVADRDALLVEVKRLKALCGKAAIAMWQVEGLMPGDIERQEARATRDELKEAAE